MKYLFKCSHWALIISHESDICMILNLIPVLAELLYYILFNVDEGREMRSLSKIPVTWLTIHMQNLLCLSNIICALQILCDPPWLQTEIKPFAS